MLSTKDLLTMREAAGSLPQIKEALHVLCSLGTTTTVDLRLLREAAESMAAHLEVLAEPVRSVRVDTGGFNDGDALGLMVRAILSEREASGVSGGPSAFEVAREAFAMYTGRKPEGVENVTLAVLRGLEAPQKGGPS